ncbi:MAG TPA: winged helix-turn-helix domain-containing protein [Candidatus Acidoferrales bacterium]
MPKSASQKSTFRFGLYELDGATGELRKDGKPRPRIQGQPLEVLLSLFARPGDVVTREELRLQLWPADTFVDYDHSLNTAVNKLREALGDSADNPRFIQTIPRRGYRFISSLEIVAEGAQRSAELNREASASEEPSTLAASGKMSSALSDPQDLPDASRGVVQILFSLIQIMYLCFYIISLARLRWVEPILSQSIEHPKWLFGLIIVTALVGIPVRLYLLTAAIFGYRGLPVKFLRLFPFIVPLDELWALAPFLLVEQIGIGLALAATAALLYLPFSQRSLMLMRNLTPKRAENI